MFYNFKKWLFDVGQLFYIAIRKFITDDCFGKASSLAYVTVLSVVPASILIIALFSSFESTKETLIFILDEKIIPYFFPAGEKLVAEHFEGFLKNVNTLTILGISFLLVAAIDIVFILERSINAIWRVKKGRSIIQNILIYWAILTLGPLVLISSFYFTAKYSQIYPVGRVFSRFLFPFIVTWFGFFVAYQFITRTKVTLKAAFIGALVAGTLWELVKYGFGFYMTEVAIETYGRIYGPIYIIFIFIFWVYVSYAILLLGAEISYLIQYPEVYRQKQYKNIDLKNFMLYFILSVLYNIYDTFQKGKGSISLDKLAQQNMLIRFEMDNIITPLVEKGLIKEIVNGSKKEYIPLKPMEQLQVLEIVNMISDSSQFLLKKDNEVVEKMFNKIMQKIEKSKTKEFAYLSYKELIEENLPSVISKARQTG